LEARVWTKYKELSVQDIQTLVVVEKWIKTMDNAIKTEMSRISQRLTQRIKELAERYETPLKRQLDEVKALRKKLICT